MATGIVLFIAGVCAPDDESLGQRRYLPWVASGLLAMGIVGMFGSSLPRVDNRTLLFDLGIQGLGALWRFEVADNGQGISKEAQDNIFELFGRGGRTTEDGTGIGLAACKSIVERHGGAIGVRSEIESGSVFYFTLPKNRWDS